MATETFTLTPYNESLNDIFASAANILQDTPTLMLIVGANYTPSLGDGGHEFLSDVPANARGPLVALVSPTVTNRVFTCDSSASGEFVDPDDGSVWTHVLLYAATGTDGTSRLMGIGALSGSITSDGTNDNLDVPNGLMQIGA